MAGLLDWFVPSAQKFDTGAASGDINDYLDSIKDITSGIKFPTIDDAKDVKATKVGFKPVKFKGEVTAAQVDPTSAASAALNFNTTNAAAYGDLAAALNLDAVDSRKAMLTAVDPKWQEFRDAADSINLAQIGGEIPQEIQASLARTSAYKAIQGGFGGTEVATNLTARDLGTTGLALSQQGQTNAMAWRDLLFKIGQPTQVLPSDIMAGVGLTSGQVLQTQVGNADRKLSADSLTAQLRQQLQIFNKGTKVATKTANADRQLKTDIFNVGNDIAVDEFNASGTFNATSLAAQISAAAASNALSSQFGVLSADQSNRQNAANSQAAVGQLGLDTTLSIAGLFAGAA